MSEQPVLGEAAQLWRNHAFVRLWFATMVSHAGTQITNLALPLTAALTLNATPAQMGLLAIAGSIPNLLFGLFAGVWVDRTRRMPLMIWTDLGRAVLLASIPLAALFNILSFAQVWVIAFITGTLSIFFTIASVAVLPSVVEGRQLVEANSKFALSDSLLSIVGPGAAGAIVQFLSAPKAIILDAISYILSALSLSGIKLPEKPAQTQATPRQLWIDIRNGMQALVQTPLLRALTVSGMIGTLGFSIQGAVSILFLTRELDLSPTLIGLLSACGGGGALVCALVAARLGRLIGMGSATILGNLLWVVGVLFVPLAHSANSILPILIAGSILASFGATLFSVNQMSLRQQLTSVTLLGRVTAARRFIIFSLAPLGSLIGGVLGTALGLRSTLVIGGVIGLASVAIVFFSPVRGVKDAL